MTELPKLSLFEIAIRTPVGSESLAADFLVDCGFKRDHITEREAETGKSLAVYSRSSKLCAKIQKSVKNLGRGFRCRVTLLQQNDWFDKWQLEYQIMPLGKKFMLIPLWQKEKYRPKKARTPIYLDPMGTSGSGEHPTTQIMAEFLEQIAGKFKSCLDLGTGTGILAVLAGHLGAQEIFACDIDRRSVKAAQFNLKENGIRGNVFFADVTRKKLFRKYDLVCANLISPVLEKIKKSLFAAVRPGGYLAISGIHKQNFPSFKSRFRHAHFRCVKILARRGWTGMLFKRTS